MPGLHVTTNFEDVLMEAWRHLLFFHSSFGGVLLKHVEYFKEAWEGTDLGVLPTFNMLHSSVATYVRELLICLFFFYIVWNSERCMQL